jgi:four helix bundle protein
LPGGLIAGWPDGLIAGWPDSLVAGYQVAALCQMKVFPISRQELIRKTGSNVLVYLDPMRVLRGMKSYRDLEIYRLSKELAVEVHKVSLTLPKHELYEEGQQVRRSSKAITSAIVEGYARRRYKKDYIKYLIYSQAECDETMMHIDFIIHTNSICDGSPLLTLGDRYDRLSKMINRYTTWVEENFSLPDRPNIE